MWQVLTLGLDEVLNQDDKRTYKRLFEAQSIRFQVNRHVKVGQHGGDAWSWRWWRSC